MDFEITPNGNLKLFLETDDDRTELVDMMEKSTDLDHGVIADILEYTGWQGNGRLYSVRPEDVGALTDAPILSDDVIFGDDGSEVVGNVWWFPNYQVESFAQTLLKEGVVTFDAAPENVYKATEARTHTSAPSTRMNN